LLDRARDYIAYTTPYQQIASTTVPYSDLPPICLRLHEAKARKGLTFAEIGSKIGRDEVWVAALFYGQVGVEHHFGVDS
jgi:hypothetical protein